MKINYTFVKGENSEAEVNEEISTFIFYMKILCRLRCIFCRIIINALFANQDRPYKRGLHTNLHLAVDTHGELVRVLRQHRIIAIKKRSKQPREGNCGKATEEVGWLAY